MLHFASCIQTAAYTDNLIIACGILTYAQKILMPELLVMLIKEDLGINSKIVYQILEESTKIKKLLNSDYNRDYSD
jgi:hypothetical protein